MTSPRIAWCLIAAVITVPACVVLFLGSRHSTRDILFEDVAGGVNLVQRRDAWIIGLSGIEAVEISRCPLDLVRSTITAPKSLALLTASVPDDGFMVVRLVRPRNLQIVAGMESPVAIGAGTAFSGRSLTWSFDADRDIFLFAEEAILEVAASTRLTPGSVNRAPLPQPLARISIAAGNGIRLACRTTKTSTGIRYIPSVALIAQASSTPIHVAVGADVADPTLSALRGSVLVGNRKIALGAGTLAMGGDFKLDAVEWTPGGVEVKPLLHGKSRDVHAGGDQLVPSTLSTLTEDPRFSAILAVAAVFLGSLVGKLFDHAMPKN